MGVVGRGGVSGVVGREGKWGRVSGEGCREGGGW